VSEIPEESENMNPEESESGESAFNPPARLAARFQVYRPPPNRRSAASSRRNSLSSTHSLQSINSNSSYQRACRNNHVAQYLRRASILEGRKARLAAREAHAEQVRLRATLAKTAPRQSNSEEKALAAQQARERHLAQVAASCADQVRKAKRIAEETRERRTKEEERVRTEMEEKLVEAQRRRNEYKRNNIRRPRTASSPPTKSATASLTNQEKESAVTRLQRAWRMRLRKRVIENFMALGLSIDRVHDTTFEEIRALLCDDHVLRTTAQLMRLFQMQQDEKDQDPQAATRIFLTAYLILGHPNHVLTQDGDQEHQVIEKAKDVIISFEHVLSKASNYNRFMPAGIVLQNLQLSHAAYTRAFGDWKAKDKTILIELCVQDFVYLDAIWQTVKGDTDGQVADDYKDAIRENQVKLLGRLRKLAGPERANILIRKGINENRRQQNVKKRKPTGDARPRVAETDRIHSNIGNIQLEAPPPSQIAQFETPTTPIQSEIVELLTRIKPVMPANRIVTHELVIDKNYRLDNTQQAAARDQMLVEFCRLAKEYYMSNKAAEFTVHLSEYFKSRIMRLLPPNTRGPGTMRYLVEETLDSDLIKSQAAQGIFNYQTFFEFMARILPQLCAPVRDEEVKALADDLRTFTGNLDDMFQKLFKCFVVVENLSLDFSNFLLSNVAPKLISEAAAYERKLFAQELHDEKINLRRLKRWWNDASVNVLTEADRAQPSFRPSVHKIYARGLVDLAIAMGPLREEELPETLELDRTRIAALRSSSTRVAVIGSILLGAKNMLKRDVRSQWRNESNRMWDFLKTADYSEDSTAAALLKIAESAHSLPPATKTQLQATIGRLCAQASTGKLTDPVARVLFQRLKTHIFHRVGASTSGERARGVSNASESLAQDGLPEFGAIVNGMVNILIKISDADRDAHGLWYEEIAEWADDHKDVGQDAAR
jgi:hypothetical protein